MQYMYNFTVYDFQNYFLRLRHLSFVEKYFIYRKKSVLIIRITFLLVAKCCNFFWINISSKMLSLDHYFVENAILDHYFVENAILDHYFVKNAIL